MPPNRHSSSISSVHSTCTHRLLLLVLLVLLLGGRTFGLRVLSEDTPENVLIFGDGFALDAAYGAHGRGGFLAAFQRSLQVASPNSTVQSVGLRDIPVGQMVSEIEKYINNYESSAGYNYTTIWLIIGQGDLQQGHIPQTTTDGIEQVVIKALTHTTPPPKVVLTTAAVVGEKNDGSNALDSSLDELSALLYRVAVEYDVELLDLRFPLLKLLQYNNPEQNQHSVLTHDGFTLNPTGHSAVSALISAYFELPAPPEGDVNLAALEFSQDLKSWMQDSVQKLAILKQQKADTARELQQQEGEVLI